MTCALPRRCAAGQLLLRLLGFHHPSTAPPDPVRPGPARRLVSTLHSEAAPAADPARAAAALAAGSGLARLVHHVVSERLSAPRAPRASVASSADAAAAAAAAASVEAGERRGGGDGDGGVGGRNEGSLGRCVEEDNVEAVCGWLARKVAGGVSDEEWGVLEWEVLPRLEDVGIGHRGSLAAALAAVRRRYAAGGRAAAAGGWAEEMRGLDPGTADVLARVVGHLSRY